MEKDLDLNVKNVAVAIVVGGAIVYSVYGLGKLAADLTREGYRILTKEDQKEN